MSITARTRLTLLLASTALPALAQAQAQAQPADTWQVVADQNGVKTAKPEPGQVIVRLNGSLRFYGGWFNDQDLNRTATTQTETLVNSTVTINGKPTNIITYKTGTSTSSNKQDNYGLTEFLRLYPSIDGVSASGIHYGASAEIRQDNTSAPGGGIAGSISGANVARGELYVRREYGYIGLPNWGTLRVGTQDSATSLMLTGVLEGFNDGGWRGDVRYGLATQAQLRWPYSDDGSAYTTNKIVYLSPSLYGFDLGLSFEPSTAGVNINDGNCAVASASSTIGTAPIIVNAPLSNIAGCDRLDSTTNAIESARRRNTADVTLRYRHAFDNGVGLIASASYTGGGHVAYTGPAYTQSGNNYVRTVTYQGLSVADLGVALSYAGVELGANYMVGNFSNSFASGAAQNFTPAPAGSKRADAWYVGSQYTFGPAVVGAGWISTTSPGAYSYSAASSAALSGLTPGLGQRLEEGLNAGGTLKVAPGLNVFLSFLYDERKQSGYDFVDSAIVAGTADPTLNNRIHAEALTLGTAINW